MTSRKRLPGVLPLPLAAILALSACDKPAQRAVTTDTTPSRVKTDFNRDVRPILSDRCFGCHGPDGNKGRQAGLRLDTLDGATTQLKSSRRAIVPGNLAASEMVARIHSHDADEIMPPAKLNRPLNDAERDTLVRWIAEGAEYQPHWAFVPARKHAPPEVSRQDWVRDDLDRFVLAKLDAHDLTPNPEADRASLLRRAAFALTGLPPSPEAVDGFLMDDSPDAYEKQIDALLDSPAFGERLAQDWLDVARFADTYGYQSDLPCFVWPWRDWVIRAFNENLPFDRFVTWQIAGDLLENPTQDQRLATTFNRLHRQTQEGGSIEAEFRQEYISDRVHTYGTAFLGLTLECAKCHDHKYDPIPQTDYYSLASMFGQIDECGLYPYSLPSDAPEPSMRLEGPEHAPEIAKRTAALDAAKRTVRGLTIAREPAFLTWLSTAAPDVPPPAARYQLDEFADNSCANQIPGAPAATVSGGQLRTADGGMEFDGDTVLQLNGTAGITRHDPLGISLRILCPEPKDRALILHSGPAMFSQAADASGFELLLENGRLRWSCIHLWPGCAASIETTAPFPTGRWVDVTVTYDGSSRAGGMRMMFDGKPAATTIVRDQLDKAIASEMIRVGARPRDDRGFTNGIIANITVHRSFLTDYEIADPAGRAAVLNAAKAGDPGARERLREFYLTHVDPVAEQSHKALAAARKHLHDDYLDRIPRIMAMKDSPYPKTFHVLTRGDYASPDPAKPVPSSAPAAVMTFGPDLPRNRLGLARWTTHSNNPLTARVAVNRFWIQCFGNGIVPTQENFGLQGDPPTHQALLDSLSRGFTDGGWNVKRLLKRIVMSATFRQASAATPEKLERDPRNLLLSRGPAFRLSAEAIRDQALAAAGLLVMKTGGPSVKPWQPPGLWSEAGASGGDYQPGTGEDLYRRSLYTYRKRTAPPPALLTLDAGSREICQARRMNTNTPLQPLLLLNDPSFFECARKLAERCAKTHADDSGRCAAAFRILTCRNPRQTELKAMTGLYQAQLARYSQDPAATKEVSCEDRPDLAALILVCSTLLSTDAAVTVR